MSVLLLRNLRIKNFRNLNIEEDFSERINCIYGKNASGKSNFLDAIFHLYSGSSFKPYSDGNNINWEDEPDHATIDAHFFSNIDKFRIVFSKGEEKNIKTFLINTKSTIKKKFLSEKKLVIFTPHHLNIISGAPEDRRNELDLFLSQVDFEYESILKRYKSVIRNRNKVLERILSRKAEPHELEFWNEKLVNDGSLIIKKRLDLFIEMDPILDESARELFREQGDFSLKYISKIANSTDIEAISSNFQSKIEENANKEIFAGRTLYGPHRDDWEILLDKKSLKIYGSRGQQRIASLIFKYAEWKYLTMKNDYQIVILLDDIFSELDSKNSDQLKEFFSKLETQIFITSTQKEDLISDSEIKYIELK